MEEEIACEVCGGNDFYKEAGFFYCKECQTQSQAIKEHCFSEFDPQKPPKNCSSRSINKRKKKSAKGEDSMTSWECYNYILLGLVNEMIELGAGKELKKIVHVLWYKYLKSLEVIRNTAGALPKLSAVKIKKDAEILYGRPSKRQRRRSNSTSSKSESTTSELTKRDRSIRKRALAQANYEEYMETQQSDMSSIFNQSLSSLKTDSKENEKQTPLKFNKKAKKELLRSVGKEHLAAHANDFSDEMQCHPLLRFPVTSTYWKSSEVITKTKLFAIIYLGLLINKDKLGLSDMMRFIREGHLSYNECEHFLPEDKKLNMNRYKYKGHFFSYQYMRDAVAKLAVKIKIHHYLPLFDIFELCRRYCKELNLPGEIYEMIKVMITGNPPRMPFTESTRKSPNYEGRAMSLVIFVLKLLFGFDGATEFYLSDFAEEINRIKPKGGKMFNFKNWLLFIKYRRLVISEECFSFRFLENDYKNPELFLNFLSEHRSRYEEKPLNNVDLEIIERNLSKLKRQQKSLKTTMSFPPSLTPLSDYLKYILDEKSKYLNTILRCDFSNSSLEFLKYPYAFLNEEVLTVHGGLNKNFVYANAPSYRRILEIKRESKTKSITTKIKTKSKVLSENTKELDQLMELKEKLKVKKERKNMLKLHKNFNSALFEEYTSYLKLESSSCKSQSTGKGVKVSFNKHYRPEERFWLLSVNYNGYTEEAFQEHFRELPFYFQLLLKECALIIEQNVRDLYEEYVMVELYLCYKNECSLMNSLELSEEVKRFLNKVAVKMW